MSLKENRKVSKLNRYLITIKNGLFFFGLRNQLAKLGIDFQPYYWMEEQVTPSEMPIIKDDPTKYTLRYLTLDEVKKVSRADSAKYFEDKLKKDEKGIVAIGLEHNGLIATFMYAEFNDFDYKGRLFKLKPNESYLLNMWTFQDFRGKNLAPYLRYQAFQLLKEQGKDVNYSISDYFNKSSIKFKKKLNTEKRFFYLSIYLFAKFKWNFILKKY